MQKMQVLFPEPVFRRLRAMATEQDRAVSELVRRAVDRMLEQAPPAAPRGKRPFPTFHGGGVLVPADKLKGVIYSEDE